MLIYFDRDTTVRMLGVFEQLLAKEGWLFVDSTEVPHVGGVFEGETLNGVRAFHKHGMKKAELNKHLQTTFTPNYDPRPQAQAQTQPQGLPTVSVPAVVEPFAPHVVAAKSSPQPVEDISEKRRLAEQAYKNKQFEESLRLYDQLIDQHPLWASWARLGKARVLLDSGEELEALETAETALSAKKMTAGIYLTQADEADAHAIIVLVLHNKGLKSKLAEHLKRVRHLNPKHEVLRIVQ
jgi:tetratricopeptide (TPR) repeat protein